MKKRVFLIMLTLCTLCSCQKTPESIEKEGIVTVKDTILSLETVSVSKSENEKELITIPENLELRIPMNDDILEIDAKIVPIDSNVYTGTLKYNDIPDMSVIQKILFDGNDIHEVYDELSDCYTVLNSEHNEIMDNSPYVIFINYEDGSFNFNYGNNSLNEKFSIDATLLEMNQLSVEQLQFIDIYKLKANSILKELGYNHTVTNATYYNSTYPYVNFQTTFTIDGITCCNSNFNTNKTIQTSGSVCISDNGLYTLGISEDYVIGEKNETTLMNWDSLLEVINKLCEEQSLRRIEDALPITEIELKYMIKNENDILSFYPVWCFEAYFPIASMNVDVFGINAGNGNLEFMNAYY